jgi:B12-binding domain/radical SAM domain protein
MKYDVILLHPPVIYDFRRTPLFTGALGDTGDSIQLVKVPVGMLSIADYLDRHGYKVIIDNLGYRMVEDKELDIEKYIGQLSAEVFAIGLHWHHHAQGAIEIARLCKKLHPESLVILGGLTSTCFHEEIIKKYAFVDAIIRGEAERPFLKFIEDIKTNKNIKDTPNLTYRSDSGEICVTPLMEASDNLDEFEYTRLDLLSPEKSISGFDTKPRGSLLVCRGCLYNCPICGGSAYTYKTYLGMGKPAFRSPEKIITDMHKLNEQGIHIIGLYQDPRMGGKEYWKTLMAGLRKEKLDIELLTLDIFSPVDEEFVREVATIGKQVTLYICPDSGDYNIRRAQGRYYSNDDLLKTVKLCHKYHIPVTTFFSVGLPGETPETIKETMDLCERLYQMDRSSLLEGKFSKNGANVPIGGPIISYIFLDPGSPAFDSPEEYRYKLKFQTLEEIIEGRTNPSWHQWLNYETDQLDNGAIIKFIYESFVFSIQQREKYGVYDRHKAAVERIRNEIDRFAVNEVEGILSLQNGEEQESRLVALREVIDSVFNPKLEICDRYGYKAKMVNYLQSLTFN